MDLLIEISLYLQQGNEEKVFALTHQAIEKDS
jgi:hypothetical protein